MVIKFCTKRCMPEGKHLLPGAHFFVKIGNFGVSYFYEFPIHYWEQGLCSGESTCLPLMWPGLNSRTWHHMW